MFCKKNDGIALPNVYEDESLQKTEGLPPPLSLTTKVF
jgi:hypothetical protein